MSRRPPRSTRTDIHFPDTTLCRTRRFGGIVVTNYLHRPLLAPLTAALAPGGVLIYETFARGNERFGKPSNPAFLLEEGELLRACLGRLKIVAYEDVVVEEPRPAAVRSEEHTSELQSLMRHSNAVSCLK